MKNQNIRESMNKATMLIFVAVCLQCFYSVILAVIGETHNYRGVGIFCSLIPIWEKYSCLFCLIG